MEEKESNIVRLEGLKEDYEQAMDNGDWLEARACIRELNDMLYDTTELENRVNEEIATERELEAIDQEKWDDLEREHQYYQNIN